MRKLVGLLLLIVVPAFARAQANPNQIALLRWYEANQAGNSIALGGIGVVFDGDSIWTGNVQGHIYKLRASDGALLGSYYVARTNGRLAFDGLNVWVAGEDLDGHDTVTKLKASDGTVVGTYVVGSAGSGIGGIAFDGANIWVSDGYFSRVTKLQASDGSVVGEYQVSSAGPIAFDGKYIWVSGGAWVTKLKASNGSVVGGYYVGVGAGGLAYDGENVWVASQTSNTVTKIRASDAVTLGTYSVASMPVSVAYDGTYIWVGHFGNIVSKLEASDGSLVDTYTVSPNASAVSWAIAFDGANIWVASNIWGGGYVTKM